MFELLSDEARDLVSDADALARRFGAPHVGTEHLLVAAVRVAQRVGGEPEARRQDLAILESVLQRHGTAPAQQDHVPFSPRVKEVLEEAYVRAQSSRRGVVRVKDLWHACLARPDTGARAVLAELGIRVDMGRSEDVTPEGS